MAAPDDPPYCDTCYEDMVLIQAYDLDGDSSDTEHEVYECPRCGKRVYDISA